MKVEAAGLDAMDYDNQWGRYRVRLGKGDVKKHADVLRELFEAAYAIPVRLKNRTFNNATIPRDRPVAGND